MRLALVISSLASPGGAERVLSLVAREWARRGAEVSLITLDQAGRDFFAPGPAVQRVGLGLLRDSQGPGQAALNNVRRARHLRRAIVAVRPDAVISFMDVTNVLVLIATAGLGVPVIVSERVNPRMHPIPRAWSQLRRLFYPRAAALVVQTEGLRAWAEALLPPAAVHVVANPISPAAAAFVAEPRPSPANGRTIIAMGRLTPQKGIDLLLQAFARCRGAGAQDRLVVYGEGPERRALERRIDELGLHGRALLPGVTAEPLRALCASDLFVLSSRYEGFPNVLLEAMGCGLPVVSFDCDFGPADIVRPGVDGLLVPAGSVDGLAAAMDRLLLDEGLRACYGARATEVADRFSIDRIMDGWGSVLAASVSKGRKW